MCKPFPGRTEPSAATRALTLARVILGPSAAIATYVALPVGVYNEAGELVSGLAPEGHATAAVAVLMAIWWLLEAIPLSVTALLPVALLPLLGAVSVQEAAAPYARDMIFLFFGGFMVGLAMERWGLHQRIALLTLRIIGTSPSRIVAGFMLATAFLSAWVSNTATAILMLPIATSVVTLVLGPGVAEPQPKGGPPRIGVNFSKALLLGIAYAASIGGVATLIGTPPNIVMAAVASESLGHEISMIEWITVAVPVVLIFLPLAWLVLTRVAFPIRVHEIPGAKQLVADQLRTLGPMSRGEMIVLALFVCTACAWVFRPQLCDLGVELGFGPLAALRDSSIALLATLAMFMIPVKPAERVFVMDWETVESKMPWAVLLLFGGGLSLASAITSTGVDAFIGRGMEALDGMPEWALVLAVAAVVNLLSCVTSNTALTTAVLPVLVASAPVLGVDPMKLLYPATLAASFAFLLPVSTPPNAVVFGTGRISIADMARAGAMLCVLGVLLATAAGLLLTGPLG